MRTETKAQDCKVYGIQQKMALNFLKKLLLLNVFFLQSVFALEFSYNGFKASHLLLYGTAKLKSSGEISLTRNQTFSVGRALYHPKIPTKSTNSKEVRPFSTSFTFSITPYKNLLPGHGLAFILVPSRGIEGAAASQHLGIVNATNDGDPNNHIFAVEFDVFRNEEFRDINGNHVGIDVNSVTSIVGHEAGYWSENANGKSQSHFKKLKLNNGSRYRVWIEYGQKQLNVTMAPSTLKKPLKPLISIALDLSSVVQDTTYAGFSAATGQLLESHEIHSWSFSN